MKFQIPVTVTNITFININTNQTYFNPDGSTMSCIDIISKPDDIITIDGAVFDNIITDNDPAMISITKGNAVIALPWMSLIPLIIFYRNSNRNSSFRLQRHLEKHHC